MSGNPEHTDHIEPDTLVGTLVAGRYQVLRRIGAGGMGAVYEVEHVLIGRRFALKTLHAEYSRNAEAIKRFHREARAAAAIGDDHIIEVSDMGNFEDGLPFIVLELLEGQDLAAVLRAGGPMSVARAVCIARQACGALERAHEKDIVHRDIKPDNIFVLQRKGEDFIKLLDFGISKVHESALGLGTSSLTRSGTPIGTPYYMAPEQIAGDPAIDARADVYAMGVVVFEMLLGRVPFDAPTYPALVIKVVQEPPPSLREHRPDVPVELEAAVMRALAKSPAQRFARIEEFAAALAPFESLTSTPPKVSHRESFSNTATPGTWEVAAGESIRIPERKHGRIGVLAALAAFVIAGIAWALQPAQKTPEHAPAPPVQAAMPQPIPTPQPAPTVAPAPVQVPSAPTPPQPAAEPAPQPAAVDLPRGVSAPTAAPAAAPAPRAAVEHRSSSHKTHVEPAHHAEAKAPPSPPPPAVASHTLVIDNQRRAAISVSLECAGERSSIEVGALARVTSNVPAATCKLACRGIGNPYCPSSLSAATHRLEVK